MNARDSNRNLPRKPDDSSRHVIVGQTGTGKTAAGVYALALRSYDRMPWIIANYKNDEYLNAIGADEISPADSIPSAPGIYMVRPECEPGSLDRLLIKAHARGGVGFYIDEGYEVGQHSAALRRVLTQGRSLRIPVIILSQRPVWMSKYVFSEMTFLQAFPLLATEDRKRVVEWMPEKTVAGTRIDINYPETLEDYQSLYFDAGTRRLVKLGAVPYGAEVLDIFDRRRPKRIKRIS